MSSSSPAPPRDVLRLLELVRSRVLEHFKVELERNLCVVVPAKQFDLPERR